MKYNKGQISIVTAIIGSLGVVFASGITAWTTASGRVNQIDTKVQVVEERENNHYFQVKGDLDRIEDKIDRLINSM